MSERMFTSDEVSAIVKRRLASRSAGTDKLNPEVVIEMLRNVLERLDAIEQRMEMKR